MGSAIYNACTRRSGSDFEAGLGAREEAGLVLRGVVALASCESSVRRSSVRREFLLPERTCAGVAGTGRGFHSRRLSFDANLSGRRLGGLALGLLAVLLLFDGGSQFFYLQGSVLEFLDVFRLCGQGSIEPLVLHHLLQGEALGGVGVDHAVDQLLEVIGQDDLAAVGLLVHAPVVLSRLLGEDAEPLAAGGVSNSEGRLTCYEHEEDHAGREDVRRGAIVGLALNDFRGHVTFSTDAVAEHSIAFRTGHGGGEAEVGELDVALSVEEQVLQLEVAVADVAGVEFVESYQHLAEELSGNLLGQAASYLDEVEDIAMRAVLEHLDPLGFVGAAVAADHGGALDELVHFKNEVVVLDV